MENASKALIIAGAILISILLISIGIIIMNSISGTVDQAGSTADQYTIQQFNANFTGFEGTKKGSALRELSSIVQVSNAKNPTHSVTLNISGGQASTAFLVPTQDYNVTLTYTDGYVSGISVQ